MNSSQSEFSDDPAHVPEIITLMDDDEIQQNIITKTTQASRRKSTAITEILNSSGNNKADKVGHRRRKTFHKILNADDEITFESIIRMPEYDGNLQDLHENNIEPKAEKDPEKSPSQNKIQKLKQNAYITDKAKKNGFRTNYNSKANPNTEFIQRVAFLRSCVNYMLKNAGKEAIDFKYGENTLSKLVNNYNCISNEPEEIVLSD